jgi:hypothetical protein
MLGSDNRQPTEQHDITMEELKERVVDAALVWHHRKDAAFGLTHACDKLIKGRDNELG